jgi:hypothetical protein
MMPHMDFHLEMYGPRSGPPGTVRELLGKLHFTAGDGTAAVAQMRKLYAEPLGSADYSRLLDDNDTVIWQSGAWDA